MLNRLLHSDNVGWRANVRRRGEKLPQYALLTLFISCLWAETSLGNSADTGDLKQVREGPAREYALHQWGPSDGLPSSAIQCLLQTRDGYLWVGTSRALLRFDGERFLVAGAMNCLCLAEDNQGILWIGAEPGLFRCQGNVIEPVTLPGVPLTNGHARTVFSFCPCPDGGIWFDSGGDLYHAVGNRVVKLVSQVGKENHHGLCYSKSTGQLYLATAAGLQVWIPTNAHFPPRIVATPLGRICCVGEDADGDIWFGAFGSVHCLRPANDGGRIPQRLATTVVAPSSPSRAGIEHYSSELGGQLGWVLSLAQDPLGTIWLGTSSGLWQVSGHRLVRPPGLDGVTFGGVNCLCVDREGNLFLGTESKGLVCLEPNRFTTKTTQDGLADDDVWSVSAAPDGSVWIGTAGGLSHYIQTGFENYGASEGLASEYVRLVFADSTGTIWVGTQGIADARDRPGGLYRLQRHRFRQIGPEQGITRQDFISICEDQQHHVWVNDGRPHECIGGAFQDYTLPRPSADLGGFMFVDHDDCLWLCGSHLDCFEGEHEAHYDLQSIVGPGLYGVAYEDEHGALWLGSSRQGLIRFKDGQFRAITTRQGLYSDLILSLQEDAVGNYWMNSHTGVFRARKDELNAVADGRQRSLQCVVYGKEDGLLSVEGNGGTIPNSCKTEDGRLWFPTIQGVAVVDPSEARLDDLPPQVIIESLRADGKVLYDNLPDGHVDPDSPNSRSVGSHHTPNLGAKSGFLAQLPSFSVLLKEAQGSQKAPELQGSEPHVPGPSTQRALGNEFVSSAKTGTRLPVGSELRLPPGRGNSLEVRFTATTLLPSERVRFKYRLLGRDKDWIDLGTQRFVSLEDLPQGHYTFDVTACSRHGIWNAKGAQLAFQLAPFFYQTWTFYGLCTAALVLGVSALQGYRLSCQRRILRSEQQAALANERERIARDMHDDLGASLTRIALLTEVARKQLPDQHPAGASMDHVSSIARQVVDGISELIWVANPHFDTLSNLVAYLREYAARFCASAGLECKLEFPPGIPHRPLPADFRRQVLLMLKEALHNIQKHSGATRVNVQLALAEDQIELTVVDNGHGFRDQESSSPGHGLANMRHRATDLGGAFEMQSDPGRGTTLRFFVPLPCIPE